MSAIDLAKEMWAASANAGQEHIDRLAELGVEGNAFGSIGQFQPVFGVQAVRWLPDGLYEPDHDGGPAVVTAVFHYDDIGAVGPIDLIAWKTSRPARWHWRIGQGWALGEDLLACDEPVPVVATPLDWLRAGGDALCILDWSAPSQCWTKLRHGPPLRFTSDAFRQRVRNRLVATAPLPCMEITDAA